MSLTDADYAQLLALRTGLRRFQRWSGQQAAKAGLTPAQHQLLLAVRGHDDSRGPTIGEVADYLLLRHHSAVGLVDRAEAGGYLRRERDSADRRVVRLKLTEQGAGKLAGLASLTLEELERLASETSDIWHGLASVNSTHGFERAAETSDGHLPATVTMARVYDASDAVSGLRVLVDRLWPRGLARDKAGVDEWLKEVAPSNELRRFYGHEPSRFKEFARRYLAELEQPEAQRAVQKLRNYAEETGVVLLTASKDLELSQAAVLKELLAQS